MSRQDKINDLMRNEIAQAIAQYAVLKNGIISVTYVDCSSDLKSAKIGVSVMPDNIIGSALRELKKRTSLIVAHLKKRVKIRKIPKLIWVFDPTGKEASALDKIFEQIANER